MTNKQYIIVQMWDVLTADDPDISTEQLFARIKDILENTVDECDIAEAIEASKDIRND